MSDGDYGKGGDASLSMATASGGSGGYNTGFVDVTPNSTITVIVGAGGKKYEHYITNIISGNSGFVLIAYGGDI